MRRGKDEEEGSKNLLVEDVAHDGDGEADKSEEHLEEDEKEEEEEEVQLVTPPAALQIQSPLREITYQTPPTS